MKIQKTNAMRLLDKASISYETISYPVDENDLSALHVAEILKQNIQQIFKTLILTGDKVKYLVCIIPGDKEINLKLAANVSGNKKAELIPMKDLLAVTGYVRGGCSPIGMKKSFPTYIDSSCLNFDNIFISAGQRGIQISISPKDLIGYTQANVIDLTN